MLEELKLQSLQKNGPVIHPNIPIVIFDKGGGYCIEHYKKIPMNVGSMRGHLRGKAHKIDPETGIPLDEIDLSEMIKESQNKVPIKSEREVFDDFFHIVTKICALKNRTQAIIIASHTLEGRKRTVVLNHLFLLCLKDTEEAEAEKKKAEDEKKKAESDKFMAELEEDRNIRMRVKLGIRA